MTSRYSVVVATCLAIVALPAMTLAQHRDLTHDEPAEANESVAFGVLPTGSSLGSEAECLVVGNVYTFPPNNTRPAAAADIGGPNDPCSYKLHQLTPPEVTIVKDGQVTFQI